MVSLPSPTVGTDATILAALGALVLAVLTGTWRYLGLPVYWCFRHLFFLVVTRDGDTVRAKWGALFADEMTRNDRVARDTESTRRDVTALMESVGRGLPQIGELVQNVGLMAQEVRALTALSREVVLVQQSHGESIARLDERVKAAYAGPERRFHEPDEPRQHERRQRLPRKPAP